MWKSFFCLDGQKLTTTATSSSSKKMNINISCSIIRFTHTPILASFFNIVQYQIRLTKFDTRNRETKKTVSNAPFHSHARIECEERKGTQTMIFFVSEHFVENSLRLCVFVVSSFDVQFNVYIGMNRLRWCSLPQCRLYTKTYSHSVIDTGSCGCSCCMTAYGIIREMASTMYAVFRPTPSDCTF